MCLCDKHMCMIMKCNGNGSKCIFSYHSPDFFGLVRSDNRDLFGNNMRARSVTNEAAVEKNARKIRRWLNGMGMERISAVAVAAATEESES
jgi:hypothetical protein